VVVELNVGGGRKWREKNLGGKEWKRENENHGHNFVSFFSFFFFFFFF
jgi:hypothetical protein